MKKLCLLILAITTTYCSQAQNLKKYPIGNSGCSVYLFCNASFEATYSEDSSKVYTGECTTDSITYGAICVSLVKRTNDLGQAEEVMVAYLDYLKKVFNVVHAAGYGTGHHLNNNEDTRGIIDYWQDKDNNNWKIKAWTEGKYIAVIYAFSIKALPDTKVDVVLNSFRFP